MSTIATGFVVSTFLAYGGTVLALLGWRGKLRKVSPRHCALVASVTIMVAWGLLAWLLGHTIDTMQ